MKSTLESLIGILDKWKYKLSEQGFSSVFLPDEHTEIQIVSLDWNLSDLHRKNVLRVVGDVKMKEWEGGLHAAAKVINLSKALKRKCQNVWMGICLLTLSEKSFVITANTRNCQSCAHR